MSVKNKANNDKLWAELQAKLPWQTTPESKQKRDEIWGQFDVNGNGYLSLAEIDKGMRDVIKLPGLFALKPVLMRAYVAAKTKNQAKNEHSDDYVTKGEFRFLLKYLRQYYEYWVAFDRIDTDSDRRVSKQEFLKAVPVMKNWGLNMSNPDQQWKEADKDGKGMVLFDEFSEWAIRKNLDLDDDDNLDENQKDLPSPRSRSQKKSPTTAKAGAKPLTAAEAKKQELLWQELAEKLPWQQSPEATQKRTEIWRQFDVNGNGYLSLAEVDKGMRDVVQLPGLFALKPVLMRAFQAAKIKVPSTTKNGNDYITKGEEFRCLLKYLRQYYEYFIAFERVDSDSDRRVNQQEFLTAVPIMKNWGLDMSNPDQQWKEADRDGKGMVLFDEFSAWAIMKNLDLDDDDNLDDNDKHEPKSPASNVKNSKSQAAPAKVAAQPQPISNAPKAGAQPQPTPAKSAALSAPKTTTKTLTSEQAKKQALLWTELQAKLPWQQTPEATQKRKDIWNQLDVNGNGYLSLAEVDKGMRDVINLPDLFSLKPVLMRAFQAAKNKVPSKKKLGKDFIDQEEEFRLLLKYLRQYYEYWIAFERVDSDSDRRVSKQEFMTAVPVMKNWGLDMSNPDQQWKEVDRDGKGMVLFNEFSSWAIMKNLDLDDDDNLDKDANTTIKVGTNQSKTKESKVQPTPAKAGAQQQKPDILQSSGLKPSPSQQSNIRLKSGVDDFEDNQSIKKLESVQLKKPLQSPAPLQRRSQAQVATEAQMIAQEAEDDSDLAQLKDKLAMMKQMPQPENKDEMIGFLIKRLQAAEEAINTCDQIISHERSYRKQMSQQIKQKNAELREIIEEEKKTLSDKIGNKMAATVEMAVQDRMLTQKKLTQTEQELQNVKRQLSDLQIANQKLIAQKNQSAKDLEESRQQLQRINAQLKETDTAKARLAQENLERTEQANTSLAQRADAVDALKKLDEVRVVMSRLMGPSGSLSQIERQKFLPSSINEQSPVKRLTQEDGRRSQLQPRNGYQNQTAAKNNYQGGRQVEADPAEDFWYQTPKTGGKQGR